MIDFLMISTRSTKRGVIEIYPKFIIKKSSDLMIRGGDFYAIWLEERGLWSTDEQDALQMIDRELDEFAKKYENSESVIRVLHMWDSESGMIDNWHKYCQRQMRDSFHMLDEKLIFSNNPTNKKDYASKRLSYPLEKGSIDAYDKLMSTLYDKDERKKIEWAVGSIIHGDSVKIQKFLVLYGAAGTGKSTVLNIIQKLFDGYYSVFDAKALGSSSNTFALEAFKTNPLVAIQHDGDLSRIEDNTRLNSLVSHEMMTVNEKFKSTYSNRFKSFLFLGTNKPVKITDAKSGLIRRLIDVSPSGNKLNPVDYKNIIKKIDFELGAIAYHCQEVYLNNVYAYDDYIPVNMLGASNDFYNFILDSFYTFKNEKNTTLKVAWEMYKTYCDDAKVLFPFSQRTFKEELKNYFKDYKERFVLDDGTRVRSYYTDFKTSIFEKDIVEEVKEDTNSKPDKASNPLGLKKQKSILDSLFSESKAQYATENKTPKYKWKNVKTKLKDLDTSKLHYLKVSENYIVVDFDIKDKDGNKSLELNIKEAIKFPETYSEVSQGGQGLHLYYIYDGDVSKLSRVYDDNIEVKVFTGDSAIRRRLTKCNNKPIATINSGLPLKGETLVNWDGIKNENMLRTMIKKNLNKEYHSATKPSVDYIHKLLKDAYDSDITYDVSDMQSSVLAFAASSSNQSEYCIKLVDSMKFKSKEAEIPNPGSSDGEIIFYDVEVFPNLFVLNWKKKGPENPVIRMINPTPIEVSDLLKYKLVGFNCRRYDNHIIYARVLGYTNEQLFKLSQKIINGDKNAFFGQAYNLSYTDIYDFASAGNKKSLKKLEIEMGIKHKELGLPWDKPVPEDKWILVAEYCDNDVIATEAAFDYLKGDWMARQILADIAGMTVNDTTNTLSTKIIFGDDKNPQDEFNYRDMGDMNQETNSWTFTKDPIFFDNFGNPEYTRFNLKSQPVFPGYVFESGKSIYRGEEIGEGGYVYAEPGIYHNVALLDVVSMHPSSIIAEELFGPKYTKRFEEIVQARIYIKHKDFESAKKILNGLLKPYIEQIEKGVLNAKDLANALKTAINLVYGLTSAKFNNAFRDNRNKDNIVAKRGALFMVNLKHEVQARGYTVAHIKTDSIKIPNADEKIIAFIMDYGKQYGYIFEHEATYEKMCLVNDAVYIAKYKDGDWTATGTQFAVPYIFKTLFSKEKIKFEDLCETKSVTSALYLDFNENLPDNEHNYTFVGRVGNFCPMKDGTGGGILLRESEDKKTGEKKYSAVTGSKGYKWMESVMVSELGKEKDINKDYYNVMVDKAVETISKYGDFEQFVI